MAQTEVGRLSEKEGMNYNLLEERWIPVLWTNGEFDRMSVKTTLMEAHRIRQIAASNPMDRVAILRFLLALLYWCKGNRPIGAEGASGDSFPPDWFSKLDDNKDCFNLLGEGKRFYQYRRDNDKRLAANYLMHEIPTGTNLKKTLRAVLVRLAEIAGFSAGASEAKYVARVSGLMLAMLGSP